MDDRTRVLYIDDHPERVKPIVDHLRDDFDVEIEKNVESARSKLAKEVFDVIILDWEMVDQPYGTETLIEIRKENAYIKAIMVTAKLYYVEDLAKAVNAGVSRVYFKNEPDMMRHLTEGIKDVVNSRDQIVQGLEVWLMERRDSKEELMTVSDGKSYTAAELLKEIKSDSTMGRKQVQVLVNFVFDSVLRRSRVKKQ